MNLPNRMRTLCKVKGSDEICLKFAEIVFSFQ